MTSVGVGVSYSVNVNVHLCDHLRSAPVFSKIFSLTRFSASDDVEKKHFVVFGVPPGTVFLVFQVYCADRFGSTLIWSG